MSPSSIAAIPKPRGHQVHVWRLAIPTGPVEELLPLLSGAEQSRAARYTAPLARQEFIAARGGLRILLGRYLGERPETLRFREGGKGKPALDRSDPLQFNVAHSHGLALLAIASSLEVGVDVESAEREVSIPELLETVCSASERAEFAVAPLQDHPDMFFRLWTAKEAYVKAVGGGLSIPLKDVTVGLAPDDSFQPVDITGTHPPALVASVPVPRGYVGALAVTNPEPGKALDLSVRDFPAEWLRDWR